MITEYDVLKVLDECNGATYEEISSSAELADKRSTYRLLKILEAAQLVKPAFRQGEDFAYCITPVGRYRLQQLKEQIDLRDKATAEAEQQNHIESIRFWITFVVTLIGTIAAIGSLIATIALR